MRTLASEILAAADAKNQPGIWAHLFDVTVGGSSPYVLYLTDYIKNITYSGHTYNKYPIAVGDIQQTLKAERASIQITIANLDNVISQELESGTLLGNEVKIYWIFIKQADDTVVYGFSDTYQLLGCEIDDANAAITFDVGKHNLFKPQLPRNRWIDQRCEFVYKHPETCSYGIDRFGGYEECNLLAGGNTYKLQGWYFSGYTSPNIPLTSARIYRSDREGNGYYPMINKDTGTTGDRFLCPMLYRTYNTNSSDTRSLFYAYTTIWRPTYTYEHGGIIFRDTYNYYRYIYVYIINIAGVYKLRVEEGNSSSQFGLIRVNIDTSSSYTRDLKIERTALNTYVMSWREVTSSTWTTLFTQNRSDFSGYFGVGLVTGATSAPYAGDPGTKFDYFETNGGYLTCNRSISDCRIRQNMRRYGGAPGILKGALIL